MMKVTELPSELIKYIFTFFKPFTIDIIAHTNPYFLSIKRKLLNPLPLVCKLFQLNYNNIVCPFCYHGIYTTTKSYEKGMFQFNTNCNTCGHRKRKIDHTTDSSRFSRRKIHP